MSNSKNNPELPAPKPGPAPECVLSGNTLKITARRNEAAFAIFVHPVNDDGSINDIVVLARHEFEVSLKEVHFDVDLTNKLAWLGEQHPAKNTRYIIRVKAMSDEDLTLSEPWDGMVYEIRDGKFITEAPKPSPTPSPAPAPTKLPPKPTPTANEKLVAEQDRILKAIEAELKDVTDGYLIPTRSLYNNKMRSALNTMERTIKEYPNVDFSAQTEKIAKLREEIAKRLEELPTKPAPTPTPVPASSPKELAELTERLGVLERKMQTTASAEELKKLKVEVTGVKAEIASMQKSLGEMKETGNTTLLEFRAFANRPQTAATIPNTPQPQVIYLTAPASPASAQNPVQDPAVQKLTDKIDEVLKRTNNPPTTLPTTPATTTPPVIQQTKNKKKGFGKKWVIPILATLTILFLLGFASLLAFGPWVLDKVFDGAPVHGIVTPPPPPANNMPDEATRRMYMAETDRANAEVARNGELQRKLSMAEYARERAESNAVQLASTPAKPTTTFGNVGNGAIVANNGSVVTVFPTTIIERQASAPKREIAKPPKPMGFNPAPPPPPQVQSDTITETTTMHGPVRLLVPEQIVIYDDGCYQEQVRVRINPHWAGMIGSQYGYWR